MNLEKQTHFQALQVLHRVILQKIQLHRLETITRTRIRTQQTTILIILVENN